MNRDPRDPSDDPFFNNNNKGGGFDPFNDPFFKHIEQIQKSIFRDFFGDDNVTIFSIEGPGASSPTHGRHDSNTDNAPDLSAINPDAPSSSNSPNRHVERNSAPGFLRLFEHFFEPEYDDHKLSDINPNLYSDAPIMDTDRDNQGLVHPPHGPSPGFRSPYLPNWNGAEKEMNFEHAQPNTFFRSQSVTITTGPDGKTRKTTTTRDSSGQEHTSTEEFDGNHNNSNGQGTHSNSMPRIFYWNDRNGDGDGDDDDASNEQHRFGIFNNSHNSPMFEQTHDPFARLRHKWQHWRYNPYNWYEQRVHGGETPPTTGANAEWMWSQRNEQREPRQEKRAPSSSSPAEQSGIRWRSYRDYQSEHNEKRPSLLDDIIKKD